jgi:hypothetical protein
MTGDLTEVQQLAATYRAARDRADQALGELQHAIEAAHRNGATEYALTKTSGLPRGTIRRAIGRKP